MFGRGWSTRSGESRVVYPTASDFSDSLDDTILTVNGLPTIRTNALATLRLAVGAGCTRIVVVVNIKLPSYQDTTIGVRVDGVYQSLTAPALSAVHHLTLSVDPSAPHVVEITPGWLAYGTDGTWIRAVSCEGGSATVLPNPSVSRRLSVYGDSNAVGAYAVPLPRDGWIPQLRLTYPGRISLEGWGGHQYAQSSEVQALAARLVGLCFDAATKEILDAMGFNDWWSGARDLSEYTSTIAATYDAIHALAPTARVYCQTPLITGNESGTNSRGDTIGQLRTAKAAAASGRSWVEVVDGPSLVSVGNLSPDGIHLTSAGHAQYAESVGAVLA